MADIPIIVQSPKPTNDDSSDTQIIVKPSVPNKAPATESHIFSISIRSILSIILTGSVAGLAFMKVISAEQIFALTSLCLGFYFGNKTSSSNNLK